MKVTDVKLLPLTVTNKFPM